MIEATLQVQQTLDAATQASSERPKQFSMGSDSKAALRTKLKELTTECKELGPSILVSATYDGERRVAVLKFYEPSSGRVYLWSDHSGHKPHCISKLPVSDLLYLKKERSNIIDIVPIQKRDLIQDKEITVSKIVATDPLAIGGQENSLRNVITAWEADIKYYENYLYDNGLYVGAFYKIQNGELVPAPFDTPSEVQESLKRALKAAKPEMAKQIEQWASLLNQPLPYLKRAALDIEVLSSENRIPNADIADQPVVAASLVSDNLQRIYLLDRKDVELGKREDIPTGAEVLFFAKESDLLIKLFSDVLDYPFVATFNGDDFDLSYLYHRAQRPEIGLTKEEIPIVLGNNFGGIKHGVHIDLYKTFNNRSLQIYAFGNKYSDHTLNGVAEGLLDESKIEFDGLIGDLPIYELAKYNLQDTLLTYKLVSIYNDVLLKLLIVIARVGKMPIDDLSRLGVSNWIRSMLYFEHRRQNALIPRPEELKEKGGAKSEAIIKGKKYKGGLVIDPISGVHFNVSVLDFASLYPSIIKVHNISYETVNCPHPECRSNVIPEVGGWTCTKNVGIESLVVGSLRDLRVEYYKQLTKSKTLSKEDLELYKVVSQGLKVLLNACFTGDTDVLTTDGIKNIRDLRPGDRVVNVNPDTMEPEIDEVVETQDFPYDDEIYSFKNGKQIDLKVTKNHRFLVKQGERPPAFLEARDLERLTNISIPRINSPIIKDDDSVISLASYKGSDKFAIELPLTKVAGRRPDSQFGDLWKYASNLGRYDKRSKSFVCDSLTKHEIEKLRLLGGEVLLSSGHSRYPFEFKLTDFAELCGWIISEGNLGETPQKRYENGNFGGLDYGVVITQSYGLHGNPRGNLFRLEIANLLDRMKLKYNQYETAFRIANPALHRFCVEQIRKGARNKKIPSLLMQSSTTAKQRLMLSLIKGDGSLRDARFTTASETLATQICSVLAQLGYRPRMYKDNNQRRIYRVVWYSSAIGLTHFGEERLKWISKEKFNDRVYCLTTKKNHTVFAGRNGIFVPVGQSYGVLGFESFPLYCLPAAEAVASLGRYSITKTIEECRSMGIEVVYSDSVGSDSLIRVGSGTPEKYLSIFGSSNTAQLLKVKESLAEIAEVTRIADLFCRVDRTGIDGREYYFPEELYVETLDESGHAAWGKVKYVMRHKTPKQVYRVWLTNHWSLDVTEDHSLIGYVNSGRKAETNVMKRLVEVKPLELGTSYDSIKSLIVRKQYPRFSINSRGYPRVLYEFMGFFIGDGCFHFNSDKGCCHLGLALGKEKAEILSSLLEPLRDMGVVRNYWSYGQKGATILNGLNLITLLRKEIRNGEGRKRIPQFMFREKTENIFAFLRGLFSSDGTVMIRSGRPQVRFTTTEEELARQVRDLLWEVGISNSMFREKAENSYNGKFSGTQCYRVVIKSVDIFKSSVRFLTQEKNRKLDLYEPGQGKRLFRNKEFDLSPVQKVEPIRYDDYVYDIEVEGSHRFIANGVLVHNTDSLFIKAPSLDQIDKVSAWTQKQLGIEIEVDKVYRYVAMSQRKKNYFGVLQDGTVDIKGLTGKKSVAGDTPILAKIQGHVVFSSVANVYEECNSGKRVELLTVSDELKTQWSVISEASRHRVTDVYLLKTSKGRNLKLSGDHSVYLIDRFGKLFCKETRELKTGDVLIGAQLTPENPVMDEIDVSRYLGDSARENNGMLHSSSSRSTTGVPIPRWLKVSEDLMFLFGIFTADGGLSRNLSGRNNMITRSSITNTEVYHIIKSAWVRVFGYEMKEYKRRDNSSNFYLPVLHAKLFREACGRSSAEKHAPDFIFDLPRDLVAHYLLGLFIGDGYSDGKRINFASASRVLVEQVAYLLTLFDIDSRVRRFGTKYFQLSVIGTSSRVSFQTKIGFLHSRFQTPPRANARNKELIPVRTAGLIELERSILKRQGLIRSRKLNMHDDRYYNMMLLDLYNKVIHSLLEHADMVEKEQLLRIHNMINTRDVSYDELISIEKLPGEEIMYDFASPQYQRFVAGNLPTLLHNSQTPQFIKNSFEEILTILSRVKSEQDFDQAREEIKTRLKSDYQKLRNKEISMQDLAFNVMIGKDIGSYKDTIPQHVRAAQILRNSGKEIKAGDIISFVKTTTGDGAKPTVIARKDEVDVEKYIDYMRSTFDQILGSLGYDFDEILGATKLEDFFWPSS